MHLHYPFENSIRYTYFLFVLELPISMSHSVTLLDGKECIQVLKDISSLLKRHMGDMKAHRL